MEQALGRLNDAWRRDGLPTVGMRVGIHTGPLVAGSLGNGPHMEYCLLGDTANTAARIEQLGKEHAKGPDAVTIMVGDPTWRLLGGVVAGLTVGEVPLKGKRQRVLVHRIDSDALRITRAVAPVARAASP
jgi:adenylate cyclase